MYQDHLLLLSPIGFLLGPELISMFAKIMVWERGVPFVAATVSIATNVALAGACAIM